MGKEIKALIVTVTSLPDNLLKIVAKIKGKKPVVYERVSAPASDFLREGESVESLSDKDITLEVEADGAVRAHPFYSRDPAPAPKAKKSKANKNKDTTPQVKTPKRWKKLLISLKEHEDSHDGTMRASHKKGSGNGILCPECDKFELKDESDDTVRLGDRPTIAISCICGYAGRRSL